MCGPRPITIPSFPMLQQPAHLEYEPPFDPSAFWRYPDWDSGPITEPFWMRPLKLPLPPIENYL